MSTISVCITTYGTDDWRALAWSRAYPSVADQGAHEVIVHHEPDMQIGPARNATAAKASGDWLLWCDADDELAPGFVEAMKAAIHPRAGRYSRTLLTPAVQYVRRGRPQEPMFWPEVDLRTGNWLIIGTLVSRWMFEQVGGFRDFPHGLEDFDLWSRCYKAGCEIVKVPEAVYVAHFNSASKHHALQRTRSAYMEVYHEVCRSNWPELFPEGVS